MPQGDGSPGSAGTRSLQTVHHTIPAYLSSSLQDDIASSSGLNARLTATGTLSPARTTAAELTPDVTTVHSITPYDTAVMNRSDLLPARPARPRRGGPRSRPQRMTERLAAQRALRGVRDSSFGEGQTQHLSITPKHLTIDSPAISRLVLPRTVLINAGRTGSGERSSCWSTDLSDGRGSTLPVP